MYAPFLNDTTSVPHGNALLEIVFDVLKELLVSRDHVRAIQSSLQTLGELAVADRVNFYSVTECGGDLELIRRYGYMRKCEGECGECPLPDRFQLAASGLERWREAFLAARSIEGHKEDFPPNERDSELLHCGVSLLYLPVFVEERLWGVFHFGYRTRHHSWSAGDKRVLEMFATALAGAMVTQEQEERLKLQQRSVEEHFALIEDAPSEIHIVDPQSLQFVYMNRTALRRLGYGEGEYRSLSPRDIVEEAHRDTVGLYMARLRERHGETLTFDGTQRRKNGTIYPVELRIALMRYDGREHVVAVVNDISRRVEDETMIRHQQNQLEAANKRLNERYEAELRLRQELEFYQSELVGRVHQEVQKNREKDRLLHNQSKSVQMGEMLSMIAHQWRQPLNAISASAIAVAMKQELGMMDEESLLEHSRFIQSQAQQMSKTINDFMDFFKPEHEKKCFGVVEVMDEISSLIGAQLRSRGIELHFDPSSEIRIDGYFKELSHVMINLIANARDAYEEKRSLKRQIEVGFAESSERWHISVQDYAGGIPDEHLEKIFNPYYTTKEPGKGTGIGLYMSRRIISEVFNGTLEVRNHEGGARFSIEIPREATESSPFGSGMF